MDVVYTNFNDTSRFGRIKPHITLKAENFDQFIDKIKDYFEKKFQILECEGRMNYEYPFVNPKPGMECGIAQISKFISPIDTLSCDQLIEKIQNELNTDALHTSLQPDIKEHEKTFQDQGYEVRDIELIGKVISCSFLMPNRKTIVRFSIIREYDHTCAACKKSQTVAHKLLKCSSCPSTYYCNKECQKKDWKEHEKTCTGKSKP